MIPCFELICLAVWGAAPQVFPLWCFLLLFTCCFDGIHMHIWLHILLLKHKNTCSSLYEPCLQLEHHYVVITVFWLCLWFLSSSCLVFLPLTVPPGVSCPSSLGSVIPEQLVVCLWHLSPLVTVTHLRVRQNMLCIDYLPGDLSP